MGIRVLHNDEDTEAVLYCSTTEWAFGPVIRGDTGLSASEVAEQFIAANPNARGMTDSELAEKFAAFEPAAEAEADENARQIDAAYEKWGRPDALKEPTP